MGPWSDVWASKMMYGPVGWCKGQWCDVWTSWVIVVVHGHVGVMYGWYMDQCGDVWTSGVMYR